MIYWATIVNPIPAQIPSYSVGCGTPTPNASDLDFLKPSTQLRQGWMKLFSQMRARVKQGNTTTVTNYDQTRASLVRQYLESLDRDRVMTWLNSLKYDIAIVSWDDPYLEALIAYLRDLDVIEVVHIDKYVSPTADGNLTDLSICQLYQLADHVSGFSVSRFDEFFFVRWERPAYCLYGVYTAIGAITLLSEILNPQNPLLWLMRHGLLDDLLKGRSRQVTMQQYLKKFSLD